MSNKIGPLKAYYVKRAILLHHAKHWDKLFWVNFIKGMGTKRITKGYIIYHAYQKCGGFLDSNFII